MKNRELANVLEEIADLYEMRGVQFKPRAYRNAANSIRSLGEDIEDVVKRGDLEDLPGIGSSTADKVEEFLKTGEIKRLKELKKDAPEEIRKMTSVETLGPKKVKKLYEELGIKTLEDLKEAAREGKIEEVEGFGEKTQKKILENIAFAEKRGKRYLLGFVQPEARSVVSSLEDIANTIEVAGSLRRKKETIGDIDILVVPDDKDEMVKKFTSMDSVDEVISKGKKKSSVRLNSGIRVDLRIIEKDHFGSALLYFTGSKQHNISVRKIAQKRGWKLSEYGLFDGEDMIAGKTEEEVYGKLDLDWIPPEMREDNGEIDLAAEGKLPELVERADIRCDLQLHSKWSDGKDTLRDMAEKCREIGHDYMAITDHGGNIAIAHALDLKRIKQQKKEIDDINDDLDGFTVIQGLEANIDKNGKLDVDREVREEVDLVLGSIHSAFRMESKNMTERLVNAVKSDEFHILAHPTGRKIQERKPLDADLEKVMEEAKDAGTIMEINAYPDRLDLNGYNVRKAVEVGVKLSIGTDSHRRDQLHFIDLGVSTARRGWAKKDDIVNTLALKRFSKTLKDLN